MEFKFFEAKKFDDVIALHKKVFHENNKEFFHNLKNKPYYKTFVATQGNTLVAYCIMSEILGEAELINIATDAAFRNMGVAKKLLSFALEKIDAHTCFLEVSTANDAAIKLYKSVGFEQISIRKKYYGEFDAIVMKRTKAS